MIEQLYHVCSCCRGLAEHLLLLLYRSSSCCITGGCEAVLISKERSNKFSSYVSTWRWTLLRARRKRIARVSAHLMMVSDSHVEGLVWDLLKRELIGENSNRLRGVLEKLRTLPEGSQENSSCFVVLLLLRHEFISKRGRNSLIGVHRGYSCPSPALVCQALSASLLISLDSDRPLVATPLHLRSLQFENVDVRISWKIVLIEQWVSIRCSLFSYFLQWFLGYLKLQNLLLLWGTAPFKEMLSWLILWRVELDIWTHGIFRSLVLVQWMLNRCIVHLQLLNQSLFRNRLATTNISHTYLVQRVIPHVSTTVSGRIAELKAKHFPQILGKVLLWLILRTEKTNWRRSLLGSH